MHSLALRARMGRVRKPSVNRSDGGIAMSEVDDRLAGDPVWELFPYAAHAHEKESHDARDYRRWFAVACLVAAAWLVYPPLAVVTFCLAVVAHDFRNGRQLARSIPDKAGGSVCARFAYAWCRVENGGDRLHAGIVVVPIWATLGDTRESAAGRSHSHAARNGRFRAIGRVDRASGLLTAYRTGMRIWIGDGENQAKTLLLSLIVMVFTVFMLGPYGLLAHPRRSTGRAGRSDNLRAVLGLLACLFVAPIVILVIFGWASRRILADRPGKFGSKVPTVGKWDFDDESR